MLTGRDTLRQMDTTLRSARGELKRLDAEYQATSRAVTQNKLEQARAIDRMAGIRLDAARHGEVVEHLESAMREARKILESRDAAIESISDQVQAASQLVEELEDQRATLHEDVDTAARTLAEREAAVQQSLEQDATFLTQLERTREADAIAVSALEKATLAAEDRRRKGEPFEADELFMYLWERGYGTSAYSANPLVRMLDGWVAKRCGYHDARPNYWMLLEIPKRLAEHAEHARDASDAELDRLQDIEELAASDGDVPEARAELESLEQRQDGLDGEIVAAETQLGKLQTDQGQFTSGADDYLLKAVRTISAAMERRDISDLTRLALATMTPEDDAIVDELRHLRRQYGDLQDELQEVRDLQRQRLSRVQELEKVRREFKRSRYDDVHSRFDKREMIERMIGEVIGGVIQGGTLWKALRRYQQYQDTAGEWPDFGSGGIVRPRKMRRPRMRKRSPTWHWPGSESRRGGFKLPRPPIRPRTGSRINRRGRGGFRTGGGI